VFFQSVASWQLKDVSLWRIMFYSLHKISGLMFNVKDGNSWTVSEGGFPECNVPAFPSALRSSWVQSLHPLTHM
jgi:hypothetical protein